MSGSTASTTHTLSRMYDFNACVRLQEINLRHPYRSLDEMQKTVSAKLSELQARFPRYIDRVSSWARSWNVWD